MTTGLKLIGVVPVLVTLNSEEFVLPIVAVPKLKLFGLTLKALVGACPVPVKVMVCGDPVALSVMLSVADLTPAAVGKKLTVTSQDENGFACGSEVPQSLLLMKKSLAFGPEITKEFSVTAVLPVFISCIV
jgi:hypothetical protein